MLPGQHAWLRAPTAAETIPSDMIILGLGTHLRSGTEGCSEKCRHLYRVLAASSLLKVGLKTPKDMDFSFTLLNSAAFYKQPKNFKILPAHSLCPCPSPLAEVLGSWRWPSLHQPFPHHPVPPGTALRNWPLLRKSCLQLLGPEKCPGTGLLPNKAESYMRAIKRHLFI